MCVRIVALRAIKAPYSIVTNAPIDYNGRSATSAARHIYSSRSELKDPGRGAPISIHTYIACPSTPSTVGRAAPILPVSPHCTTH